MMFAWVVRLWVRASMMSARNWLSSRKPTTRTTSPPRFSVTMRRVSEEENRASTARRSHRARRRQRALRQRAPAEVDIASRCASLLISWRLRRSGFPEAISDAIERFDHFEFRLDDLELLAQALDVAVDRAIVDIDLIVVGRVHQGVAALDDTGSRRERLQDQEFGDRERDRNAFPSAGMPLRIHFQSSAFQDLRFAFLLRGGVLGIGAPKDRLDALDEQALRKR